MADSLFNKKVTVIMGSPKIGYTSSILDLFLKSIKPIKVDFFNAYKIKPSPCIDCGLCKVEQRCTFCDLDALHENLKISDIVIFASPIYNLSFTAPMKSIIDRTQRYFNARFIMNIREPIKRQKKSILISASGSRYNSDIKLALTLMERQIILVSSVINSIFIGKIFLPNTDKLILNKNNIYSKIQSDIENIIQKK